MTAINDPLFWILIIELTLIGAMFTFHDKAQHIVDRAELSLRIGFATFLLIISGGTYSSIITVEKDGVVIEEYKIGYWRR